MTDTATATVTFAKGAQRHDVELTLNPDDDVEVDEFVEELEVDDLAWAAASEWPESGWGTDNPAWGVVAVVVHVDGQDVNLRVS